MKPPHQIAEDRMTLSEEYSRLSDELGDLMELQAVYFNTERTNHKSDKATERAFDTTPSGIRANRIKLRLKAIEKELSATNTYLRLLENQGKNLY